MMPSRTLYIVGAIITIAVLMCTTIVDAAFYTRGEADDYGVLIFDYDNQDSILCADESDVNEETTSALDYMCYGTSNYALRPIPMAEVGAPVTSGGFVFYRITGGFAIPTNKNTCQKAFYVTCGNCSAGRTPEGYMTIGGAVLCDRQLYLAEQLKYDACPKNHVPSFIPSTSPHYSVTPVEREAQKPYGLLQSGITTGISSRFVFFNNDSPAASGCSPILLKCEETNDAFFPQHVRIANQTSGAVYVGAPNAVVCADKSWFNARAAVELCMMVGALPPLESGGSYQVPTFFSSRVGDVLPDPSSYQYMIFNKSCDTSEECTPLGMFKNAEPYYGECKFALTINCTKPCGVTVQNNFTYLSDNIMCGTGSNLQPLFDETCQSKYNNCTMFGASKGCNDTFMYFAQPTTVIATPSYDGAPEIFVKGADFENSPHGTANDYCLETYWDPTTKCDRFPPAFYCAPWLECSADVDPERPPETHDADGIIKIDADKEHEDTYFCYDQTYYDDQMTAWACGFLTEDRTPRGSVSVKYRLPYEPKSFPEDHWLWSLTPSACEYQHCGGMEVCNFAFNASSPETCKDTLNVACNPEWEFRLNSSIPPYYQVIAQAAEQNKWDKRYYGVLEGRPKVPSPGSVEFTAFALYWNDPTDPDRHYSKNAITDGVALQWCRYMFPQENFTTADVLLDYGTSDAVVSASSFDCKSTDWSKTGNGGPLDNCRFFYNQAPEYTSLVPATTAVGIHCGPAKCITIESFTVSGAYCMTWKDPVTASVIMKRLWLAQLANGTMAVTFLDNDQGQPWNQTGTRHRTWYFDVTGFQCRLEPVHGGATWLEVLEAIGVSAFVNNTDVDYIESRLMRRSDQPMEMWLLANHDQLTFTRCSSCPDTTPDGAYCANGYFLLYTDHQSRNVFDYYLELKNPVPACQGIEFNISANLPGYICHVEFNVNDCPKLVENNVIGLSYDSDLGTVNALYKDDYLTYRPCSKPKLATCPSTLNMNFCGVGSYDQLLTIEVRFFPNGQASIIYDRETVCLSTPYFVESNGNTRGCGVYIPAFDDFESCLAQNNTGAEQPGSKKHQLFGKAQGFESILLTGDINDPASLQLVLDLIDETFTLSPCRNCDPPAGQYCSTSGKDFITLKPMKSNPAEIGTFDITPQKLFPKNKVLPPANSEVYNENLTSFCGTIMCDGAKCDGHNFYAALGALMNDKTLTYISPPKTQKPGWNPKLVEVEDAEDVYHVCSSQPIEPVRYCSQVAELPLEVDIIDQTNLVFHMPSGSLDATYFLNTNNNMEFHKEFIAKHFAELFRVAHYQDVNVVVYIAIEENPHILVGISNFGYVRLPKCKENLYLQTIGWSVLGIIGFFFTIWLIMKNCEEVFAKVKKQKSVYEDEDFREEALRYGELTEDGYLIRDGQHRQLNLKWDGKRKGDGDGLGLEGPSSDSNQKASRADSMYSNMEEEMIKR